jgi:hypothetical protein
MKEALLNIERRIPVEIKNNFLRRMTGARYNITEFSNQLKQLVNNNSEIKEVLFKNNENAIHYSGDILSNTMFDYWATGRCIEEVFVERAKHTYEYANVQYEW